MTEIQRSEHLHHANRALHQFRGIDEEHQAELKRIDNVARSEPWRRDALLREKRELALSQIEVVTGPLQGVRDAVEALDESAERSSVLAALDGVEKLAGEIRQRLSE